MTFWQMIQAIAPLAAIFGLFTLTIHIYQTRLLKRWREESLEAHKHHEDVMKGIREDHKHHEDVMKGIREDHKHHEEYMKAIHEETAKIGETQKYIANLIAREGEKTRQTIESSL